MCLPHGGRIKKLREDKCKQSGQGSLSEDATFKLKPEGGSATHGNSPCGPGIRSSSPKALRQKDSKSM